MRSPCRTHMVVIHGAWCTLIRRVVMMGVLGFVYMSPRCHFDGMHCSLSQ
uniref:Uncharacterized protein n=1 Tax=Octopus bimaculoides TaxID=37653 RepID=A0A0L8HA28_OCTBM